MITPGPVAWETHAAWFEQTLASSSRWLYVGEIEALKVGICRIDLVPESGSAEVSLNLNPAARGRGLAAPFLGAVLDRFQQEVPLAVDLVAVIKRHNLPSVKCFTRCGFVLASEDPDLLRFVRRRPGGSHLA